ncbi:hypothetical protein K503DRAFT_656630, partial [Rhizopogon vinicolor AM-OR11-026]
NGENPCVLDRAEFNANSIAGKCVTQSFWSGFTHCLNSCVMVRFARSVIPSVCG